MRAQPAATRTYWVASHGQAGMWWLFLAIALTHAHEERCSAFPTCRSAEGNVLCTVADGARELHNILTPATAEISEWLLGENWRTFWDNDFEKRHAVFRPNFARLT
eukprot:Sspe_Gene.86882::Locus_57672_Transcript_1_2_Confidence_0.500_Length_1239::g.86882::m.86882